MIIRFKSYKLGSNGLANLVNALAPFGHRAYRYDANANQIGARNVADNLLINWGCSRNFPLVRGDGEPLGFNRPMLNQPSAVNRASDKIRAFEGFAINDVSTVQATQSAELATTWHQQGLTVVERHIVNGHSGAGIRIVEPNDLLHNAPLYTVYKKKKHEFRVHVFKGNVIDIQQKRLSREVIQEGGAIEQHGNPVHKVRNHASGWVYCRDSLALSVDGNQRISELSINAIMALGLDFGAVDIIWNEREDAYYVLEVNTAVGIQGTTAIKYAEAIDRHIRSL